MSVQQYQRDLNNLDKEIADLQQKKSRCDSKIADLKTRILNAETQINKSKSVSIIKSKRNQIQSWEKEVLRNSRDSAGYGKKLSEKQKKRNDVSLKLQKAERDEQKKATREISNMQKVYEDRIDELTKQLTIIDAPVKKAVSDNMDEEYDVFISHAWEDKESFVNEFVEELENLGIKVWYDRDKLVWGDSMRTRIDEGLKKSKFGIVVISPNYIAEGKYWTKTELNGLFQMESVNGKTLLPIWHNITKRDVINYSPIIADKKALVTALMTPKEIADEMDELLKNIMGEV